MSKPTREFSLDTTFPSLIKIDIVYEGTSRKQKELLPDPFEARQRQVS